MPGTSFKGGAVALDAGSRDIQESEMETERLRQQQVVVEYTKIVLEGSPSNLCSPSSRPCGMTSCAERAYACPRRGRCRASLSGISSRRRRDSADRSKPPRGDPTQRHARKERQREYERKQRKQVPIPVSLVPCYLCQVLTWRFVLPDQW